MLDYLPQLPHSRLLVVGDVMLDRYWFGETERISPEAPVPVVHVNQIEARTGGAANVAYNLQALGVSVCLVGQVGQDEAGDLLKQCFSKTRVQLDLMTQVGIPTITKLRVLSRHQQLIRLDFEDRAGVVDSTQLSHHCQPHLSQVDGVILSDYAKGMLSDPQPLIQAARSLGLPILVDPKARDFSCYRGATLLTPNRRELEQVVGGWLNVADMIAKVHSLIEALSLEALLVTLGAEGMCLVKRGGTHLLIPAQSHEVFDVTGAGDTVVALLGAAMAKGIPLEDATHLSNLAAGLVVQKLGASAVTLEELREALETPRRTQKILSLTELQTQVSLAKNRGEKVVFTNGCFDILHAGHVTYLTEAKQLGDRLIVAVNEDGSIKKLKGDTRPIHTLEQRQRVLAALTSVDWVVSFPEDTPENLIETLQPEVLVKGGDYTPETVVGAHLVYAYGGEVKVLAHEPQVSTTRIANLLAQELSMTD